MFRISLLIACCAMLFIGCQSASENGAEGKAAATAATVKLPDTKEGLEGHIATVEKDLYGQDKQASFSPEKAKAVITAYNAFAEKHADDAKTPEYLFKAAEVHRSLKQFPQAIDIYKKICDKYTSYEKAPHSLFLLGFSYENDVKNIDEAKKVYTEFLEKHPKHELADDVQFSLSNIGKSPEDIIKEFEAKMKQQGGEAAPAAAPAKTEGAETGDKEAKADDSKKEAAVESVKKVKSKDTKPAS